jgi:hypothetical protein
MGNSNFPCYQPSPKDSEKWKRVWRACQIGATWHSGAFLGRKQEVSNRLNMGFHDLHAPESWFSRLHVICM